MGLGHLEDIHSRDGDRSPRPFLPRRDVRSRDQRSARFGNLEEGAGGEDIKARVQQDTDDATDRRPG